MDYMKLYFEIIVYKEDTSSTPVSLSSPYSNSPLYFTYFTEANCRFERISHQSWS